jgi:hypothetical protein
MKYPIIKSEFDRNWLKYCGFLDLSVPQFMSIQESLLMQQIEKMSQCRLGRKILRNKVPQNLNEFRRLVPLTQYGDYLPELERCDESSLGERPHAWAHTSAGATSFRKVPVTDEAYRKQLDNLKTVLILSCSKSRGHSSASEEDKVLFNVAPRPYLSGVLADGAFDHINVRPIISPDDHDDMDFSEKMTRGFETSLRTGMDILVAMTSVLVKTGNEFDHRSQNSGIYKHLLHPGEFGRLSQAFIRSKLEKRKILPKDIWPLKSLICWGIDTDVYRDQVFQYWGSYPYQFHACTEAGIIAVQTWTRKGMTFIPNSNFYEFIPEDEWARSRQDIFYQPQTVLLPDLIPGERYELVITSFYGMPFMRYRLGHLIRITDLQDEDAGINLPQMVFESRSDDLIDIAGFTRVCEKSISRAIAASGINCEDWVARKETSGDKPLLHLYIELNQECSADDVAGKLHDELTKVDQGYHDLSCMMEIHPLRVTLLNNGCFKKYSRERRYAGFELAQQRPVRMNACENDIRELMGLEVRSQVKAG